MAAESLDNVIKALVGELSRMELKAGVTLQTKGLLPPTQYIRVVINDIMDDIATTAQVHKLLRAQAGYGTLDTSFDKEDRRLTIDYTPLRREQPVTTTSAKSAAYHRTGGSIL